MTDDVMLWDKEQDGVTYTSRLKEAEPGVYHVSTEVMHDLLRQAGWTPREDAK